MRMSAAVLMLTSTSDPIAKKDVQLGSSSSRQSGNEWELWLTDGVEKSHGIPILQ